jgi:hypothetical protein
MKTNLYVLFSIFVFSLASQSAMLPDFAMNDEPIINLGQVNDAKFTPDEKQILLGTTKGVFFIDKNTIDVERSISKPNIITMKWSFDKQQFFL